MTTCEGGGREGACSHEQERSNDMLKIRKNDV